MLNSILATVIAGMGLFFTGLKMIDANLRYAAGRQLRMIIRVLTTRPIVAGTVGMLTGALVQSPSGIVFILVSMVSSGLATVRRMLPILIWANVGCCALIFATVLDLHVAILYLVGIAGVAYAFDRSHKSHVFAAVFGIGMLFYGMELMKSGAAPVKDLPWFSGLLNESSRSYALTFMGATGLSFITQSSTAITILAIGFAQTGLLAPFPAMMAIYGANVGSTFARMALSTTVKGTPRQLTLCLDLFKISGVALFVILLYIESIGHVPLVYALAQQVFVRIDRQMAFIFLLMNLTMAVVFTAALPMVVRFLEWATPADTAEDPSKPRYLYDEALDEPATALDLIDKEQLRLARRLLDEVAALRKAAGTGKPASGPSLHDSFAALAAQIERFQQELFNQQLGASETERLTGLQTRLSLIVYIEDSLRTLAAATADVPAGGRLGELVMTFVEALDFVLLTTIDTLESHERATLDMLIQITQDRGPLMEKIREEHFAAASGVGPADRRVLMQITSVFERVVWMLQRFARLVEAGPAEPGPTAAGAAEGSA